MADITITQEELDQRILAARTEAESTTLGKFKDYDALKADSEALKTLKQQTESETARLVREAKEATAAAIPQEVEKATSGLRLQLIEAVIRAEAAGQGFKYPDDVAGKLANHKDISVGADHSVKGVKKLVEDLAKERPEWLAVAATPRSSYAPGRPGVTTPLVGQTGLLPNGLPAPQQLTPLEQQVAQRRAALGVTGTSI